MMRDKSCPVCGDDLASLPWGTGTVWQCVDHGVKEWYFGAETDDLATDRTARVFATPFGEPPGRGARDLRGRDDPFRRR